MVQALSPAVQQDFRKDLLVGKAPGFLQQDEDLSPVRVVGAGIPRPNAAQAIKTYHISRAAAATVYTQVATASSTTRIFYLGMLLGDGQWNVAESVYAEDADTGNIAPSDASTVALDYFDNNVSTDARLLNHPRECKRGIRVRTVVGGATDHSVTIYYLEERTDGQQVSL